MWPASTVETALTLIDRGLNDCEVGRSVGVPRRTVLDWRHRRRITQPRTCQHNHGELPAGGYAYLLGMYLGDGCISAAPKGVWRLRITLDARYPEIIRECQSAMHAVLPQNKASIYRRTSSRCVEVYSSSKHWPCLFPQHGPGKKHERPIQLSQWQREIVRENHRPFLRGLIHSDGTRIVATERKGNYVRRAPRYAFRNRSRDIRCLFCESCDALGIGWTAPSETQIAIYRLESVALLDTFVGAKR
jgi:hypothetical protein